MERKHVEPSRPRPGVVPLGMAPAAPPAREAGLLRRRTGGAPLGSLRLRTARKVGSYAAHQTVERPTSACWASPTGEDKLGRQDNEMGVRHVGPTIFVIYEEFYFKESVTS